MSTQTEIDAIEAELDAIVRARNTKREAKRPKRERNELDDFWAAEGQIDPPKPQVWRPTTSVCMIHEQACATCGSDCSMFVGWWTEMLHASDPTGRRLVGGARNTSLPARVERHRLPPSDWCPNCAESQLAIEALAGSAT